MWVASLGLFVIGCGPIEPVERNLGAPLTPVETCVPSPTGKPVYFGNNSLESDSPATITAVNPVGVQGDLRVVPFVVPVASAGGGPLASFNPAKEPDWSWAQARSAEGSVIDRNNAPMDLVLKLSSDSGGSVEAVRVDYQLDGSSYFALMPNSMEIVVGESC